MDACEIANFLAKEFFTFQQFISLDGLSSGVPTITTDTLTPTLLQNIEETFIELQSSEQEGNQAGFVPPLVIGNNQYINPSSVPSDTEVSNKSSNSSMWGSASSSDSTMRSTPPTIVTQPTTRRGTGGRRPNKAINITPEEEERRSVRRERNKLAAARCRKRRLDHTNSLIEETEGLEQKRKALESDIQQLKDQRDELQFILDSHRAACRLQAMPPMRNQLSPSDMKHMFSHFDDSDGIRVKSEPIDDLGDDLFTRSSNKTLLSSVNVKISRPNTLDISSAPTFSTSNLKTTSVAELAGIPITTPTGGIIFNYDSLIEGGTGLTPLSAPLVPSCATQQRNGISPSSELNTPDSSCNSKLVSL